MRLSPSGPTAGPGREAGSEGPAVLLVSFSLLVFLSARQSQPGRDEHQTTPFVLLVGSRVKNVFYITYNPLNIPMPMAYVRAEACWGSTFGQPFQSCV